MSRELIAARAEPQCRLLGYLDAGGDRTSGADCRNNWVRKYRSIRYTSIMYIIISSEQRLPPLPPLVPGDGALPSKIERHFKRILLGVIIAPVSESFLPAKASTCFPRAT